MRPHHLSKVCLPGPWVAGKGGEEEGGWEEGREEGEAGLKEEEGVGEELRVGGDEEGEVVG